MGVPLGRRYSRPELSKEAGTRGMSVELLVCGCQRTVNIDGARGGKEMRNRGESASSCTEPRARSSSRRGWRRCH